MRLSCILILCGFLMVMGADAQQWAQTDVGGGGWLQSGTFHPTDHNIILIGTDVTGGIARTDDFGTTWYPWNEGLQNTSEMKSMYVEDLISVVEPNGGVAYYAATHAGIYRRTDSIKDTWDWMADDQPGSSTNDNMVYKYVGDPYREPISFACMDWNGANLLVAGAGRVRWESSYETSYYPAFPETDLESIIDLDTPQLSSNTKSCSVWIYDLKDLDNPNKGWTPLDLDLGLNIGAVRDISIATINGANYIVVASTQGIWIHNYEMGTWEELSDNIYLDWGDTWSTDPLPYNTLVKCWSVHLTQRGTVFAAMETKNHSKMATGVYRIYEAVPNTTSCWTWVGDLNPIVPHGVSLKTIGESGGFFSNPQLIYMSVVDGTGIDDDTIFLGCRRRPYGMYRGSQPNTIMDGNAINPLNCAWETLVSKIDWSTDYYPADFDLGWCSFWGCEVIFHPVVLPPQTPGGPIHLAAQFNGRLHVSNDGGDTFLQRYCVGEEGDWFSRGYNEHCVVGLTFMTDGRAVFSNGDTGVFRSTDNTASGYEYIKPDINYWCDPTDNTIRNTETDCVQMIPNWLGEGRDALFINYSDSIQKSYFGKLFLHREATATEPEQWENITADLTDLDHYLFGEFTFTTHDTCLMTYVLYKHSFDSHAPDYDPDNVPLEYGVLKGVYCPKKSGGKSSWDWTKPFTGLPAFHYTTGCTDIIFNKYNGDGRVFLALYRNNAYGGGLYMLPTLTATHWEVIYDGTDTANNPFRDFRSLAQSDDHSILYAGTRGRSGGVGAVLKCSDPSKPLDPKNWTVLANNPDTGYYPFGFSNEPPFWYGDMAYMDEPHELEEHLTAVMEIEPDPRHPDNIYVGLCAEKGFMKQEGLWFYNNTQKQWYHISSNKAYYGMGVPVIGFNPYVEGQLFIGTTGQGLYFNGIIPDPKPPIKPPPPIKEM